MVPSKRKLYVIENRITRHTEFRNIAELSLVCNSSKLYSSLIHYCYIQSYIPGKFATRKWIVTADFDFTDILYFNGENTLYFSAVLSNDSKEFHLYK